MGEGDAFVIQAAADIAMRSRRSEHRRRKDPVLARVYVAFGRAVQSKISSVFTIAAASYRRAAAFGAGVGRTALLK